MLVSKEHNDNRKEKYIMNAIGIIRRTDELGRIALPKEIRRIMKIKEGDPLVIYFDKDSIILKKYSDDITEQGHNSCEASLK